MVSCATKSGEGDSQNAFPLQKLEGTVNNVTLSDAVYKGVVLCGWLKGRLVCASIYFSEK